MHKFFDQILFRESNVVENRAILYVPGKSNAQKGGKII